MNASNITQVQNAIISTTIGTSLDFAGLRVYFYVCYIIFGGLSTLTNVIVLTMLINQKKLIYKWPTVAALAIGNLTSGVHGFVYGVYRLPLISLGTIDEPLSSWVCMATLIPTCHVLAYSLPPVVQGLIGFERLLAICAFNWYRIHWSPKKTWYVVAALAVLTVAVWVVPLWYKIFSQHMIVTRECSSPKIIGLDYLFTLIRFAIITGVASTACSLVAAVVGRRRMRKLEPTSTKEYSSQFRRQWKISCAMLTVAAFDLALVTVPSILTVFQYSYEMPDSAKISLYSISYCVYSNVNIVVCVAMNGILREAMKNMLRPIARMFCGCNFGPTSASTVVEVIQML